MTILKISKRLQHSATIFSPTCLDNIFIQPLNLKHINKLSSFCLILSMRYKNESVRFWYKKLIISYCILRLYLWNTFVWYTGIKTLIHLRQHVIQRQNRLFVTMNCKECINDNQMKSGYLCKN